MPTLSTPVLRGVGGLFRFIIASLFVCLLLRGYGPYGTYMIIFVRMRKHYPVESQSIAILAAPSLRFVLIASLP
jgi:hypothetical protein